MSKHNDLHGESRFLEVGSSFRAKVGFAYVLLVIAKKPSHSDSTYFFHSFMNKSCQSLTERSSDLAGYVHTWTRFLPNRGLFDVPRPVIFECDGIKEGDVELPQYTGRTDRANVDKTLRKWYSDNANVSRHLENQIL